jgi:hypothetical protein
MNSRQQLDMRLRSFLSVFLCATALNAIVFSASAADLKLESKLIWGTNDETKDTLHKPVDPALIQGLSMFKWKNYYEITNQVTTLTAGATNQWRMSSKCMIKVKNLGSSRVEVNLFGKNKWVSKGVHTLPCTIGGGDKNDTVWFVILRSLDPKIVDAKK